MRATTRFLLLGALAMCLSACLPEPPMGSEAAIFKRPSRYGWGASGRRPGSPASTQSEQKPQTRSSGNRFGHSDNKPKPNSSGSNSSSRNDSSSSRSADSGSSANSNSSSADSGSGNDDGDKKKDMADSGGSSSNSGGGNSSGGSSNKQSSSNTPPSNLNSYPYAKLVPGKKGVVTLPGIDEINVEGIKPGTPVEIDDPNNPGKKIYFRVP